MKKTKTALPSTYLKATSVTAAVLTALYGAPAHADADADSDIGGISEVTVTATRRALGAGHADQHHRGDRRRPRESGIQDIAALAHSMAGVNYTDKGPFSGVNGCDPDHSRSNSEATGGQLALASPVVPPVPPTWMTRRCS